MGIADKLGIGKSSTFVAKVTVHELSQVPLVTAKFRVKWQFKGATTSSHLPEPETEGGSRFLHPRTALNNAAPPPRARSTSPAHDARDSTDDSTGSARRLPSPPSSPPMNAADLRTPNPNRTPSTNHPSSFAFTSPFSSNSEQVYAPQQGNSLGHSFSNTSTPDDSPTAHSRRRGGGDLTYMPPLPTRTSTEPKGATTLIPLRNHTATFNREIHCPVAIPLRSTSGGRYQLQPSPVKLSIKQEVAGDDGKKEETKTGQVLLDLSQFVGNGKGEGAPRRYLLRDCKTNATLKVTVKMEFVSGEPNFVAPPLKTGQVTANSTAASGLGSSSSSITGNRSSTSLASRAKQAIPAGRNSSSTSMSRTNSSSSISTHSLQPSVRSSLAGKTKGWRPNAGTAYSSSPSPTLLGAGSGETDRNATDLIETLFNRPSRQGSWASLPVSGPPTPSLNGNSSAGDALVFSVGRGKRSTPSAMSIERNGKDKGKGKERDPGSGWGFRSGPAPPSFPPSRPASSLSFRAATSTSTAPPPPERPPRQPRRPSISGQSIASSKNLSVRWGDDQASQPPPPPPLNQRSTSSSASSILGGRNGKAGVGILRSESSGSSLESEEVAAEGGGGGMQEPKRAPRPPSQLSRANSGASKASNAGKSIKSVDFGASAEGAKGGSKGGGIEWAKSWG